MRNSRSLLRFLFGLADAPSDGRNIIEGEKGSALSWQQARAEWTEAQREEYEKFLLDVAIL